MTLQLRFSTLRYYLISEHCFMNQPCRLIFSIRPLLNVLSIILTSRVSKIFKFGIPQIEVRGVGLLYALHFRIGFQLQFHCI